MDIATWVIVIAVAVLVAARLDAFAGRMPGDLGVRDGRLKAPSRRPNSVSSQADLWPDAPQRDFARIAPLPMHGDARATIARIARIVEDLPGARIVEQRDDYLYAQFRSSLLRFVDDVEFWVDPAAGVVHVRSASRIGHGDLGVNRARIENLRERMLRDQRPAD
ncbi:MAG TPA: DUF1499 domain-containing protein [Burkholderiaceae bacterium]|nr:DUF1499 domain-containing protein [Burkholderiaceae bacterium]